MNEDINNDKDYQIRELKQRISYYEPYKQKYEDLKEDWKYIKSLLDKEFNERTRLKKENEQLRQELNGKDCRKCGNYCRDKALDYCLVDEREPYYFSFPFKWDYKAEAEKCKYYYR